MLKPVEVCVMGNNSHNCCGCLQDLPYIAVEICKQHRKKHLMLKLTIMVSCKSENDTKEN